MSTSGIGDNSSFKPVEPHLGDKKGPEEATGTAAALHTGVRTIGELKQLLISSLGPKAGTEFYNNFMKTMTLTMLAQVQKSAEHAKQAAREMRSNQ